MSGQANFSIKKSTGLERLLEKPALLERIASSRDEILEVLMLVQRDSVTEENRQTAGDIVFGLKKAMDTFEYLAVAGEASKAKRSTGESPKSTKKGKP